MSSRRSMLSRDRKVPPSTSLAVSNGMMSPSGRSAAAGRRGSLDCGAPGRLTSRIFGRGRARGRRGKAFTPFGTAGARHCAEPRFEQRLDLGERAVGNDEDLDVVGPQPALLEADQVGAGELRDRRRIAARPGRHRDGRRRRAPTGRSRRATRVGSFCSCAMPVSVCARSRSMSSGAKGRLARPRPPAGRATARGSATAR